jgi:hypothetical protein
VADVIFKVGEVKVSLEDCGKPRRRRRKRRRRKKKLNIM